MESDEIDASTLSTDLASSLSADQDCAAPCGDEGENIQENADEQVDYRRELDNVDVAREDADGASEEADGASEDDADEAGEGKVHKVTHRSRRPESVMEKLENHQFGKMALRPTKVMVQYQQRRGPLVEDSEDAPDSVEEITTDLQGCLQSVPELKSDAEVFISDGSSPETKVSIDLHVTSLICENELLRHFVGKQSTPGKPAAEMGLCKEDELLLLNDELLVDLSVDKMEALFFTLKAGTEFTMLTRRMVEQQESAYEYWQITTIIKLEKEDDEIVAEVAYLLRTIQERGSISITASDPKPYAVYIHCQQAYLKNVNGHIECGDLDEDDVRFQFDLLEYDGYIHGNKSELTKKTFCLLRYSKDQPVGFPPLFLYVDDNKVELKASGESDPTKEDLQDGTQWGDFNLHNAVFLKCPVNVDENTGDFSDDYVYLESFKQRGFFLKLEPGSVSLIEESEVTFTQNAKFTIYHCQT